MVLTADAYAILKMADNVELVRALKDLPIKIQTASKAERKAVVENVIEVLPKPGIAEPVVRGLCKVIHLTLLRYQDSFSRALIRQLINALVTNHPDWTIKHLVPVLVEIGATYSSLVPTKSTADTSLVALGWSILILQDDLQKCSDSGKAEFQKLVEAQSVLLSATIAANISKKTEKAHHLLSGPWKRMREQYSNAFGALPQTVHTVVFGSYFIRRLVEDKCPDAVDKLKGGLLDTFIKVGVSCKSQPPLYVMRESRTLLTRVTHDQFHAQLLPAINKAMLRNPEVILPCLPSMLANLSLDLSQYAADIAKSITTNLYAKDDSARQQAVEACRRLAGQCSDATAIETCLNHLFQVFHGSEGKLTAATHKMSVLQGAGNMSCNAVTGSSIQILATSAAEHFIKALEIEANEKTLIQALEMWSLWCAKFTNQVPPKVIAWLSKGIGLKTSTVGVRTAYIECMSACLNGATLPQGLELVPLLLKSVEKAVQQPTQIAAVTEGLSAVCLLLKLVTVESGDTKMSALWSAILDMDKQTFVSDKFCTQASEEALWHVMQLCERLLVDHFDRLTGSAAPLHHAVIHCCVAPFASLRHRCRPLLRRLVSSLAGTHTARHLLRQLDKYLLTARIATGESDAKDVKEGSDGAPSSEISPKLLVDVIITLCSGSNLTTEDKQLLALDALQSSHHPAILGSAPDLWLKIVKFFKLNVYQYIEEFSEQFTKIVIEDYKVNPNYENIVRTLVFANPEVMIPPLVKRALAAFSDPCLLRVTQDEYFTYLTPAGELYDKSVIAGKDNESVLNAKNMKRESKVYSYKEQLEELQLRRELEEKKRREGKIKEPELTPKQKEAMRQQLEKEATIRGVLAQLHDEVSKSVSLVVAASQSPYLLLSHHQLVPALLRALQSPLAAPPLCALYVRLARPTFVPAQPTVPFLLPDLISHITLRLLKPKCDLDSAWEQEDLEKATRRTIAMLHKLTTLKNKGGGAGGVTGGGGRLTAPAFCYVFPLVRSALRQVLNKPDDPLITLGLQIISEHAQTRSTGAALDLHHPAFLPRKQMFDLLIDLINHTAKRVQQQAVSTLLDVAASGSGAKGCARASIDEIDCLLGALQNPSQVVRDTGLRGLTVIVPALPKQSENEDLYIRLVRRVWVAKFDVAEENRELADKLWQSAKLKYDTQTQCDSLLSDVIHPVPVIQEAGAQALAAILKISGPQMTDVALKKLLNIFHEKLAMVPARMDDLGRVIDQPVDMWEPRSGVALALTQLAPLLSPPLVSDLATFFVKKGLGDRSGEVRKNMLTAALATVDLHGKDTVNSLLPVFEELLDQAPDSGSFDAVRQSVVILMGSLARHLDRDDRKIKPIVGKLIDALSTPSQQVQESVANCLPPLVPAMKEDAPALVQKLLHQLLESENYGERKGAAYGLAGLVKGMGILVLKQLDIMSTLTDAIQDKKNYRHREGALFAFEMLCHVLGRLFEPYIVHVLPHLLLCFGDGSTYVRDATEDCAKVVMGKLSAHGVKLVLPSLLAALEEDSWRTKAGSVELLGAMAFCAPKQLSSCLPNIVPKLIEVLSDSHIKVQRAGAQALKLIGSVIRNPEIQAIVPVLLEALQDPSHKTATCLQTLLDTKFVHFIDAPSLALIMPVVQRAFMDRSTETRKMAAQIIGNMYSLTDQKDLTPYLPTIIPGLKSSLLDPVPEVRSVSARALGAMVRGMGESTFEDLLPWLMMTLTSESSSVDRSGAAQGISEVVGGLGVEKLRKIMPEIISTAERTDIAPHVKDGYIMMFIYMPVVFTSEFTPYIGQIITPILKALADENEYVRDTALKAGQRIVNLYADSAIMLLLPELERGLFDDNWRIRYSSVQLLGDLLYRISGVSGKMTTETANEDDNFGTEQSHRAIMDALGVERRNRVLAGLYMGRSDVSLMVRQAALHVWKVVVTNTPRTLREILPTLFGLLLGCLASTSYDKRQVAARTLGDLVRKLGERVLPEIIPILERGLESDQSDQRQGVCIGLSEIMASTSRDMVLTFVHSLVPTVRKALCDPLPEVRQAAAKTFDSLHSTVGNRALDDILPTMLNQLTNPDKMVAECALDGLRQVMAIKSRVVLPYLVPQLTASPVNTKALSILAAVAGDALTKFLHKILPALLSVLASNPASTQELEYCQAVVLSVHDEVGVRAIMDQLMEVTRSEDVAMRRAAATLLCAFCSHTKADYSQYVPQLLRGLIHLMTDDDREVLQICWEALSAVTKTLDAEQQINHVNDIRQAVRFAVSDLKGNNLLPGFCLPKGITPILPLFREAILNGAPEIKEQAAQGLGEVIKLTSAEALQPSVVHITGPLIRILGDRFNWSVKAAVLETLALLLAKVGVMLKQFLPQLQTTFLKALNDANRQVRLKAAAALGHLIVIHTRADPLFSELHAGVKTAEDSTIRETMIQALRGVVNPAGDKMSDAVRKQVFLTLLGMLSHAEDVTRAGAAGCLGALVRWLNPDQLHVTLADHLLQDDLSLDWTLRHGRSAALMVALKEGPKSVYTEEFAEKINKTLLGYLVADRIPIVMNGVRGLGYLFLHMMRTSIKIPQTLLSPFCRTMNHTNNEVKQLVARVCSYMARAEATLAPEFLKAALPMLVNGTKEKNGYVKANSELSLVAVLRLRQGETVAQQCLTLLDGGARDSLNDVLNKNLRKVAIQPEGKEEELDDTLLT